MKEINLIQEAIPKPKPNRGFVAFFISKTIPLLAAFSFHFYTRSERSDKRNAAHGF